ncbi:unnamed protein product [Rotaria sordida]|uniref:ubiquitinyl hydrolase 1 n=1 Tax=Rotaria sordida TaxID=392033 RepID=A0A818RZK9_9BILA|nr:unnamed protein product [Rotaria sordida]
MNNYISYHDGNINEDTYDDDSIDRKHHLYNSLGSIQLQRTNINPSNYPILHQTLSTISPNQTHVYHQRDILAKNSRRIFINDDIITIDHNDTDASFILPNLYELPEDIRMRVMDNLVDIPTMVSLEETRRLNWWVNKKLPCSKLYPLVTSGDGNCLLHATSLAMWGFHDHSLSMRKALNETLITSKPNNSLYRRWRWTQSVQNKKYGLVFSEQEWDEEWRSLLRLSSAEPRVSQTRSFDLNSSIDEINYSKSSQTNIDLPTKSSSQSTRQYYESLEEFHVYVLANNIRRPIVIYSDTILRTNDGEAISPIEFGGIYLPLEISPDKCHKQPIFLAYDAAHFSALLPMEQNSKSTSKITYRIPLIDIDTFDILPIHFCIDPGVNFQWPIDEELSDDKIHFYMNYGENRMNILEKYLNLSKEYFSLNNLFLQTIKTKYDNRISTTDINLSNELNSTITNKKFSRPSLNSFSKIFRRTFIEPFSSTKRLSHKNSHDSSIQDTSNLSIINKNMFENQRSSPLLNHHTNILTIILTNFQPKRPQTSDNMIKNYIDTCMNEYYFEKNQKQINNENENLQNIEPLTSLNETNISKIINHYSDSTDTSSSTINSYHQDTVSTNISTNMNKNSHEKQTRHKLLQIPLNSLNKTIPLNQHIEKNSNIGNLLPIENSQFSINDNYIEQTQPKSNRLIQNNSVDMTNDQHSNLEFHGNSISNKFFPSQNLISSPLKRQQSISSDKTLNNSFENNQNLNNFKSTSININKRIQILNSISNLTQQKRL